MKKVLLVVIGLGVLAFLWWTVSPLFINKEVNDELSPELQALLQEETTVASPSTNDAGVTITPITGGEIAVSDVMLVSDTDANDSTKDTVEPQAVPAPEPTSPQPSVRGPFPIEDTRGHPATGDVRVLSTEEESIVRFEDYNGTNGPDLFVYLAKDLDTNEFVNLGRAKGNMGNINYTVPDDIDVSDYRYVMTWCKAFGVLFDYAEIN